MEGIMVNEGATQDGIGLLKINHHPQAAEGAEFGCESS